jgi:hypothetical protein
MRRSVVHSLKFASGHELFARPECSQLLITKSEHPAYAGVRDDVLDQVNCSARETYETGSSPVGAAIRRFICVRGAGGADSLLHVSSSAFRRRAITSHSNDPSAHRPHECHQQAKQIPLTGVHRFPAALCDVARHRGKMSP